MNRCKALFIDYPEKGVRVMLAPADSFVEPGADRCARVPSYIVYLGFSLERCQFNACILPLRVALYKG